MKKSVSLDNERTSREQTTKSKLLLQGGNTFNVVTLEDTKRLFREKKKKKIVCRIISGTSKYCGK